MSKGTFPKERMTLLHKKITLLSEKVPLREIWTHFWALYKEMPIEHRER